jgi:uncharacterized membrane protein
MGAGFAFFQPPLLRTLVSSVPREQYALASGMGETMRLAGMTISLAITTIALSLTIGSARVTPEVSGEFLGATRAVLWIFLGFSLASLAVVLTLGDQPAATGRAGDGR